jgi:hypothetical protein
MTPLDAPVRVSVNGNKSITWAQFVETNPEYGDTDELNDIFATVTAGSTYEGGGGAAATFTVAPASAFYTVAVYLIDKAYGGPEEGGWWYEAGVRIDTLPVDNKPLDLAIPAIFTEREFASEVAKHRNDLLDEHFNRHRRSDISSVLSEGRYVARVCTGYPEAHFPAVKPHYE